MRFLIAALVALLTLPALADDYPAKPIHIVVPFSPGGATDVLARAIGQKLNEAWGQPVVVENRPGAGGNIGANAVAKAPADGHTLLMGAIGPNAVNASLYADMPYDTLRDFQPVTQVASVPMLVVVHPSLPVKSVGDLVAHAKASPGKLNAGIGGIGASQHLALVLFEDMAGTKMETVTYKGFAPMIPDLLNGLVHVTFGDPVSLMSHVSSGKLRAIAVTSAQPTSLAPGLPPVAETLPGYEATAWYGILAPAGTPTPVVTKLHAEIARQLQEPAMKERFRALGAEPVGSDPAEFTQLIRAEMERWGAVVKRAGIRAE